MKHAHAQLSIVALSLRADSAWSDGSPNAEVVPTRPNAPDAAVASPMEDRKARTA
jgi:hypothetical protein